MLGQIVLKFAYFTAQSFIFLLFQLRKIPEQCYENSGKISRPGFLILEMEEKLLLRYP